MKRVRVIPVLTVDNEKLVKTIRFKKPNYIGDPINAVKIFNNKEVDEIVLLDITATQENRKTLLSLVREVAKEVNIPFTDGGVISSVEDVKA